MGCTLWLTMLIALDLSARMSIRGTPQMAIKKWNKKRKSSKLMSEIGENNDNIILKLRLYRLC